MTKIFIAMKDDLRSSMVDLLETYSRGEEFLLKRATYAGLSQSIDGLQDYDVIVVIGGFYDCNDVGYQFLERIASSEVPILAITGGGREAKGNIIRSGFRVEEVLTIDEVTEGVGKGFVETIKRLSR